MFAYCGNNPVCMVDSSGSKPGDWFETMDEAAHDAAIYINEKSIEENAEYAAYLYVVKKTYRYKLFFTLNFFGREIIIPYIRKITTFYYTYDEPVKGSSTSVELGKPDNTMDVVAHFHTHAAYCDNPNYENDTFTTLDRQTSNYFQIPSYLATPSGNLLRYDPVTQAVVLLYTDIPFDPKHPDR